LGLGLRSTLAVPATIADTGERCSAPVERLEFGELAEFARKLAAARNLGDIAAFLEVEGRSSLRVPMMERR
jgi:hypothetical protein